MGRCAAWTCAMIDPECVSPWQLSPSPSAGRGSFHTLALLLLVLCLQRRRALFRNVSKGCPWRRMQGPFLTPKKVDRELETPPVAPKRANLAKRPKVRLGLQVCNKFEVLASPVATPTPSPRAAPRPRERSLPEAGTDAPDAPGDWTTVHYRSRKKDSAATPAAASLAPPLEAPSNDNGDAIDLYYAQKDAFVRSWTRESKQARSVKQKKRVDYQVRYRELQDATNAYIIFQVDSYDDYWGLDVNEEGGMGIHVLKNVLHGGCWLLQEKLDNHPDVQKLLPEESPLSTMRVVTGSRGALKLLGGTAPTGKLSKALCAVWRAGRAGASTDHSCIMVDVPDPRGKQALEAGSSSAHWYAAGWKSLGKPWSTADGSIYEHPDTGLNLRGKTLPKVKEALELCERSHEILIPSVPLAGWDVAFVADDENPSAPASLVLLEANLSCNFFRGTVDWKEYGELLDEHFAALDAKFFG
ncbi:unnamed protein product [Symbiodinium sp. CCMP2592]|nr:unnamed protein product [Symbiodinium sp. CCMP2592]